MSKTFTCRELGGTCDEAFSGETLGEIVAQAMPHMMANEEHRKSIMTLEGRTGENREQWMARMEREFVDRQDD